MRKKKICMLGSFGVGKTSLVARFIQGMFADKYQTTVGVKIDKKVVHIEGQEVILMLWDMAGEEDGAPIKLSQVKDATGYLLVVDGCRRKTLEVALSIQQRVEGEVGRRPFILLANKADERAAWEIGEADFAAVRDRGWTMIETSAKSGQNVEEAFLQLATRMVEEDRKRSDDDEDD